MRSAILVLGLLVAACESATASPEPAPSAPASAVPTATAPIVSTVTPSAPTPTASPRPTPVASRIRPDSFVEVVTDGLRVRTKPAVSDDSIRLEPLLWKGALAFVVDGPVAGSGYDWYLVEPLGEVDLQVHADPPAYGWVAAAAKDGDPWLAEYPISCEASPLDWLQYDFDYPPKELASLSCYGDETLRFAASLNRSGRDCGFDRPWSIEPRWLDPCGHPEFWLADPERQYPEIRAVGVAIDPAVDLTALPMVDPAGWLLVDVVGQYDHPAARTCRASRNETSTEPERPAQLVVRDCRAQFVVMSMSVHIDE
jgi:hypothetical protein